MPLPVPPVARRRTRPADHPELADADQAVAHTLLNCLLREVSAPERQTAVADGSLLLRLPRRGVLLRARLRRTSLIGAHRFAGPVEQERPDGWRVLGWRELAEHIQQELTLRTGVSNAEFLPQLASSHAGVRAALAGRAGPAAGGSPETARYLESEQALVYGHRFHPAPKSRSGEGSAEGTGSGGGADAGQAWAAYAPEARAVFPLRRLAVRTGLLAGESLDPAATALLDGLGEAPAGYGLLPAHPWQYELLAENGLLQAALARGDVLDLGTGGTPFAATASVRTLYGAGAFLKFSLNVRITNCLRKNAAYELAGAVALTRLLAPALGELAGRFPAATVLREPAFRTLALPGPDGRTDTALFEGFGVIVRDGLAGALHPGVTPLLAAAVADEYPTSSAHISRLLDGAGPQESLAWWSSYLRLLVPPVLAAYFDHGVALEPHLQNVLIGVDTAGRPVQVLFRDLEGAKLVSGRHAALPAGLPPEVAGPMTYDPRRGWDRVVYCLLVNHVSELLAALADLHPELEGALWEAVRAALRSYADTFGCPPELAALLAGGPLPAKANLLTRWERRADREAGYVRLPSPLAGAVRPAGPPTPRSAR
ncbi:IucA/IucC family protein [Kitasatospora sp. NPDC057223]|uniref:IucA/IucC family protein n=1 Tax=Kitasatospora sp. NPDC057223 TaxID=3346055 RepID=UPI00363D229B